MSAELTPEQRASIANALYAGRKIQAIKELRDLSGMGLKEAKEIIDRLETDLRATQPDRFSAPERSKYGCVVAAAVLLLVFGVVLWTLLFKK